MVNHHYSSLVYDILTGKMVNGGIEGHKDIVRDVAWHPKRNEILTSSVSAAESFVVHRLTGFSIFLVGL